MLASRTFYKNLKTAFPVDDLLSAQIARLIVLYEDLRVEVEGYSARSISQLDSISASHRRTYFLRRSISTLNELIEGLRLLDSSESFDDIRKRFDDNHSRQWKKALRFGNLYEKWIKEIRNDIGGHYGQTAALRALANLPPSQHAALELRRSHLAVETLFRFAEYFPKATLMFHLDQSARPFERLRLVVMTGFVRCIRAIDCITVCNILERFRER